MANAVRDTSEAWWHWITQKWCKGRYNKFSSRLTLIGLDLVLWLSRLMNISKFCEILTVAAFDIDWLIHVWYLYFSEKKNEEVKQILVSNGYEYLRRSDRSDWFVNVDFYSIYVETGLVISHDEKINLPPFNEWLKKQQRHERLTIVGSYCHYSADWKSIEALDLKDKQPTPKRPSG